ncbi:predicted protein [Lichtheimia corymbifera JMRC:FSU:9682]|uniref:SH3 domain-containing protein n=1 Tax=Lichtheimia corymbifera JMRC:FSU:9682 TaxID=1263082 RepID=A0A068S1I1_9FUNG|nr:predicted protein [Lichtheimia corymbifera JMRC:FSU:9682]
MHDSLFQAKHAYEAQQDDELNLKPGDTLRVLNADNNDWWTVEDTATGKQGLVPSNFLVKATGTALSTVAEGPVLARIVNDYEPQGPDQLALWKNGVITVLDQSIGDGLWKGDLNGKVGLFPADHVKIIDSTETMEEAETSTSNRNSFKLAAYGVKQGGIGSILAGAAGGMGLRKKAPKSADEDTTTSPHTTQSPSDHGPTTSTQVKGMVLHEYEPQNDDELKLMRGEYVTIIDKLDDQGWWKGSNESGASGVFPSNFVQILEEQQRPPPRRTRPPTIKTEPSTSSSRSSESVTSPSSMARPPPVPVATRPTTLLTNRTSASSTSTEPPPPRPVTSPPLPTRRPPSSGNVAAAAAPIEPPKRTHKRQPSIPLVSPDLPPIAAKQDQSSIQSPEHPTRPSRPVPTPGAPPRPEGPTSSDHRTSVSSMAKPPKVGGPPKTPSAPVPPTRSRPTSQTSTGAAAVPSPPPRKSVTESEIQPQSPPPMPKRSMPLPPPSSSSSQPIPQPSSSNGSGGSDISPLEAEMQRLLDPIRKEISDLAAMLDMERQKRERLEQELETLKKQHM